MRIAVFHDYLDTIGGAERVALVLARHFHGDLITTAYNPEVPRRAGFSDVPVISIGGPRRRPPFKQLGATWRFATSRFPGYDFYVVSGNWAIYAAKHHHPNLYYCHTPTRMFFDQREAMLRRLGIGARAAAQLWTRVHRALDVRAVAHCDRIIANSETVRGRIQRFYGREALVIHPPVDTARYRFEEVGDSWLAVSRLYPEKRIDLLLEIFRRMPREKLILAGGYAPGDAADRYVAGLRPPSNVTMLGEITDDKLVDLYARCHGLIATGTDEDFGLTPVEAMASGKCVLAANEGGYRETIVDGRTGFLLPPKAAAFIEKVKSLKESTLKEMRSACLARAKDFDVSIFLQKIGAAVPV